MALPDQKHLLQYASNGKKVSNAKYDPQCGQVRQTKLDIFRNQIRMTPLMDPLRLWLLPQVPEVNIIHIFWQFQQ